MFIIWFSPQNWLCHFKIYLRSWGIKSVGKIIIMIDFHELTTVIVGLGTGNKSFFSLHVDDISPTALSVI